MPVSLSENTLQYLPARCTGCGMCGIVCPHRVFSMNGRPAELLHPEKCIECGACQLNCPSEAIIVDTGVGCAWAMIKQAFSKDKTSSCCGGNDPCCGS